MGIENSGTTAAARVSVAPDDVPFLVEGLTVQRADGRVVLRDIGFPVEAGSLLAIVGPSGCGKSTLLRALTGSQPVAAGSVRFGDRDLFRDYQELKHRFGLVPQEDILHTQLSVRRGLCYAAKLRLPDDVDEAERDRRVEEVIGELGLADQADIPVGALSGGQRKRVSVALELLTRPSMLFLDEPTSGLDPGLDKSVMEMMRELADDGHTVVVVTHSVANLDICDRLLVLCPSGRVAFYGPSGEALDYFEQPGWAEVFQCFDRQADRDWGAEFRASPLYEKYVALTDGHGSSAPDPAAPVPQAPVAARDAAAPPQEATAPGSSRRGHGLRHALRGASDRQRRGLFAQFRTLCVRYLAVIAADRHYLGLLAGLPLAMGLLVRAVPAAHGLAGASGANAEAQELLLVTIIAGCFTGAANAVREVVKEKPIYRRERAAGLSPGVYLLSKFVVLSVVTLVQTAFLVAVGLAGRSLPESGALLVRAPLLELFLAVAVPAVTSVAIGLAISALVNTAEKTMPLLVLLAMAQVVLSGVLVPLQGRLGLEQAAWLSPSRWGLAAAASTVDLQRIEPRGSAPDALWSHSATVWTANVGAVLALGVFFILVAWLSLRGQDPAVERSATLRGIRLSAERVLAARPSWMRIPRPLRPAPTTGPSAAARRRELPPRPRGTSRPR